MPTLPILTWIGNAAAVLTGCFGAITRQTQQAGCSRQVASQHADKVQQAVADAQLPGPSREELLDRKRLWWNVRVLGGKKRPKPCRYERLGLRLPTYDLWELLQGDPDAFTQQVSTQEIAR